MGGEPDRECSRGVPDHLQETNMSSAKATKNHVPKGEMDGVHEESLDHPKETATEREMPEAVMHVTDSGLMTFSQWRSEGVQAGGGGHLPQGAGSGGAN